jgi:hypothetical protein
MVVAYGEESATETVGVTMGASASSEHATAVMLNSTPAMAARNRMFIVAMYRR